MKEQYYYPEEKVILIEYANGLEIGTELTINENGMTMNIIVDLS